MGVTASIAKPAVGVTRLSVGVVSILVIGYAYLDGISNGEANPFNYFGYFTNFTGLATGVLLICMGITTLKRQVAESITIARSVAVTCMIIVAVIYNGIVPGTGSAAPWVSAALHIVLPVFVVLDWIFVSDRQELPWRKIWVVLPYPITWLTIVLLRGATDGWVPYGFLLPEQGAMRLFFTLVGLLAALLCAGAITWITSRIRIPLQRLAVEATN